MTDVNAWKNVLEGIEQALAQVEAAAAQHESELPGLEFLPPLAPDSSWQAALHAWDGLVAKLPAAGAEAERECESTEAVLHGQENALRSWIQATHESRRNLAAWDEQRGRRASNTMVARGAH